MKQIIQKIKYAYENWKFQHEENKRLKEFEREFRKEFPVDDDSFNLISFTIALAIILGIIIISIIK